MKTKPEYYSAMWGCEQTNIDFFKVVRKTAKTVWLVPVKARHAWTDKGIDSYAAMPTDEEILDRDGNRQIIKRKRNFDGGESVRLTNYKYARPWSGQPQLGTSYA